MSRKLRLGIERIVLTDLGFLSDRIGADAGLSDKELLSDLASGFMSQVYIVASN